MIPYSSYTDQQLYDLLKKDDAGAFREIYDRYHAPLYVHANLRLQDEDESRNVVQDVFVRFWEKRNSSDIKTNLSGYLFAATRNQILDLIKHQKIADRYIEGLFAGNIENEVYADHLIREKQFAEIIQKEIALLPPRMRQVFELRRLEDLSNREAAEKLGITELTAADQMKKALKILRKKLTSVVFSVFFL